MSGKTMLVTYNRMEGIPIGRHEEGGVVVYSGDYGRSKYSALAPLFLTPLGGALACEQERAAETTLASVANDLSVDIPNIDSAYVYVGVAAMNGAMELIRGLQAAGKKVTMVACDCDEETKSQFADDLGIKVIWSECGGRTTCADLVRQLANPD